MNFSKGDSSYLNLLKRFFSHNISIKLVVRSGSARKLDAPFFSHILLVQQSSRSDVTWLSMHNGVCATMFLLHLLYLHIKAGTVAITEVML